MSREGPGKQGEIHPRRLRRKSLRNALWLAADGKCQICNEPLPDDWHADHVEPWSKGGETSYGNSQALCPSCNIRKGTMQLRSHQQTLKDRLQSWDIQVCGKILSAWVWPGGGKSIYPIIALIILMRRRIVDQVMIVTPRTSLKRQMAMEFMKDEWRRLLGHNLSIMEAINEPDPARGHAGWVTTFAAVAADKDGNHLKAVKRKRTLLILDEDHHLAIDGDYHNSLKAIIEAAAFVLPITGSLDRNDGVGIALLPYEEGEDGKLYPKPEINWSLREGIEEQAIIRSQFFHIDGQVMYKDREKEPKTKTTITEKGNDSKDALYAALNTEFADDLLARCVKHWRRHRASNPRSLMLVVCAAQEDARRAQRVLNSLGVENKIAISDDGDAAQRAIHHFRVDGDPPCLVTVAMAYEGMDAKAITHVACLTHIRSKPWLLQMFNRATRYDEKAGPWENQWAYFFVPDDPFMAEVIEYIKAEQALGVKRLEAKGVVVGDDAGNSTKNDNGDREIPTITPIKGMATRERLSGMGADFSVGYKAKEFVETWMQDNNLSGNIHDVARALAGLGVQLPTDDPIEMPASSLTTATPRERIDATRKSLNDLCNLLDRRTNADPGHWNKLAFQKFGKSRTEMTEAQLDAQLKWLQLQAARFSKGGRLSGGSLCVTV